MKTNLLKWFVLLSMIAPLAANAMSIIYDVDRTIGDGSVMGTITTDGMQGDLQAANIEAFDLVLDDGVEIFTISLGEAVIDSGLSADAAGLNVNWDVADFRLFYEIVVGGENWVWEIRDSIESVTHSIPFSGPGGVIRHREAEGGNNGTEQIAMARGTSLPEPGTLGLALIGLAGLVFSRKRKQR
jgi:hypothetical protein